MQLRKPSFISWFTIFLLTVVAVLLAYTLHPPFRSWLNSVGGGVIGSVIAQLGAAWAALTSHPIWVSYIGSPRPLAIAIFVLIGVLITEFIFRRKLYEPVRRRLYSDTRLSDLPPGTAVMSASGSYVPTHTTPMAPATPVTTVIPKENET